MKLNTFVASILALTILSVNVISVSTVVSVIVPISIDIDKRNQPKSIDFDEQGVYVEIRNQMFVTANVSLVGEVDKTSLAPGEWTMFSLTTTPTLMNIEVHHYVSLIKLGIKAIDNHDIPILYQLQLPAHYDIEYVQTALIPFDTPILSGELTIFSSLQGMFNLTTVIEAKGLQPDRRWVQFSEDALSKSFPLQMQSTSIGRIRIFESYIIMTGELYTKAVLHVSGTPEPLEDECSSYIPTAHFPKTVELFEIVASKVPTTTSPVTTLTVVPATTTPTETSQEPITMTVTTTQTEQVSGPGPVPGFGIEALMALIVIVPILHRVKRKK